MKSTRLVGLLFVVSLAVSACGGGAGTAPTTQSSATAVIKVVSGVTVNPLSGTMQAVTGQSVELSGTGSQDQGSTIETYKWSVTARPKGSAAQPANPASGTTSFKPDVVGQYKLALQVTDGEGHTATESLSLLATDASPTMSLTTLISFDSVTGSQPAKTVDVGSAITLDASGAAASAGQSVTINWVLASKPAGSTATLPATGATVHFVADVIGEYDVHVIASDSTGAYAETDYVYQANAAPSAVVVASITSATGLSGSINAATNYLVMLSGSGSTVAPGDASNSVWTLVSKPSGSASTLSALSGASTNFIPDIAGDYLVTLTLTDTTSALSSTFTMTVHVSQGPVAIVSGSAMPVAAANGPTFVSSVGSPVTLLGSGSYEVGGGALTYAWTITSRPTGSTAAISDPAAMDTTFTPDLNGTYMVTLTVTDGAANSAVSTATIQVGTYQPVPVLGQSVVSVLLGGTVTDSAALSYDPQGNPLTFSWAIEAAPAGSTAAISGATNTSSVSFKPDVDGTYTLAVTVSNGVLSAVGQVTITAFSASAGTIPLAYEPLMTKYSRATDKLLIVSANPNALHIVDINGVTDSAVSLPAAVKDFSVSPDGTRAAVLHEGGVSVIDLTNAVLLNTWPTNGSQTMVLISNAGLIYLSGQTGGQWLSPAMTVLDASTGATVQSYSQNGDFYGTMHGVYDDVSNHIFVVWTGLSPVQTYSVALDSGTGLVTGTTGSPYWGTYGMGAPMWLSTDESLLFTASGTYFSTTGITYVGTLGITSPILSVSDDSSIAEVVALTETQGTQYGSYTYPAAYQLYSGIPLFPQGSVPLPLVAGQQSYGLAIFHSSTDKHVMVVQTGSSQPNGQGAQYFALQR